MQEERTTQEGDDNKVLTCSTGGQASFNDLPYEVVSHIFWYFTVRELYPNCFTINKLCLRAIIHNPLWERRCRDDLVLRDLYPGCVNWMRSYKEAVLPWDPLNCTVPADQLEEFEKEAQTNRSPSIPNVSIDANFFTYPSEENAESLTECSIRSRKNFASGVNCIDFAVMRLKGRCGVGVIDGRWNCRKLAYNPSKARLHEICIYWSDGHFWNVAGSGRGAHWYTQAKEWENGGVVGVRVDIDNHRVDYFLNNRWVQRVTLPYNTLRLWPVVTVDSHSAVQLSVIRRKPTHYDTALSNANKG